MCKLISMEQPEWWQWKNSPRERESSTHSTLVDLQHVSHTFTINFHTMPWHGGETFRNEPRTGSNRSTFIELSQRKRVSIKQHRDTIWQMQHNDVSWLNALFNVRRIAAMCAYSSLAAMLRYMLCPKWVNFVLYRIRKIASTPRYFSGKEVCV